MQITFDLNSVKRKRNVKYWSNGTIANHHAIKYLQMEEYFDVDGLLCSQTIVMMVEYDIFYVFECTNVQQQK